MGGWWGEIGDRPKKLFNGVRLWLSNPEVASLSCDKCKKYWIEGGGNYGWEPRKYNGLEMLRPEDSITPCRKCPKLSAHHRENDPRPENATELTPEAFKAWMLYNRTKAGMPMPDDALVRHYCGVIRMIEDRFERDQSELVPQMLAMISGS